ncbi:PPE domain-containing protein [Kibdelosporangium aridum]|uniref:PPE domain-containing protein n=1 Tax=Kibdelosporangium aridum TaxID=2030 RepID=UPI000527A943
MTEKERNLADSFRKLHNAQEDLADKKPGTQEYKDAQRKLAKAEKDLQKQTKTQGNRLQKGAEYRSLGAPPNPDYLGYSHEELKKMVDGRNDPGQVGTIGSSWTKLGNAFVELSDALHKSVTKSASEWQGASADAARDFTGSLSTWFNSVAQGAQLAGNRLTAQAQLAADIRNSVPPPVRFSMTDALQQANAQTDPVAQQQAMSQMRENAAAQEAAHRQAAEMVEKYDKALIDYAATMPAFTPPPTMAGSGQSGQNFVTQLDGHQPQGTRDVLDEQNQRPQLTPQQPSPDIEPRQPIPVTPAPVGPQMPSPSVAPDIGTGQQSFSMPGTSSFVPSSGSSTGFTSGSPGFSTGFVGAGAPPPITSQQPGPGSRAGVGPIAPERGGMAARPGTPGNPGMRGMPGMAGVPAGQAQREEDYEHQRADYLVEPDPNALFGIDQQTAQPVIGE